MEEAALNLERSTLSEQVASKLEKMILSDAPELSGKLPSEQTLSFSFSVSRTVIREALVILCARGLIVKANGSRSEIRRPSPKTLDETVERMVRSRDISDSDVFEIRLTLEGLSARLAAEHSTQEKLVELETVLKEMESKKKFRKKRAELDLKFHLKLAEMSGNPLLALLIGSLSNLLRPMILKTLVQTAPNENGIEFHRAILSEVRNHNPERAEELMRAHLTLFMRNLELVEK